MTRPLPDDLLATVTDSVNPPLVGLTIVGLALLLGTVAASMRVVPEHQRLVVTRLGRVIRVDGPGLARRIPALERWTMISLRPTQDLLGVGATTQDGVSVHLRTSVQCHVTDPARAVIVTDDPLAATLMAMESHLAREVAATTLPDLLGARFRFESDLPSLVTGVASAWGVEVISLDVNDIEVLLTADLLHAVGGGAGAR